MFLTLFFFFNLFGTFQSLRSVLCAAAFLLIMFISLFFFLGIVNSIFKISFLCDSEAQQVWGALLWWLSSISWRKNRATCSASCSRTARLGRWQAALLRGLRAPLYLSLNAVNLHSESFAKICTYTHRQFL